MSSALPGCPHSDRRASNTPNVSRRAFVQAATAATLATGLTATRTVQAGNPAEEDTSGILNYSENMEYRLDDDEDRAS